MQAEEIKAGFRRTGFCILEGALTAGELAGLRSACDVLLEEKPDDGGGKFHDIGRGEARRFLRHRHRDFPALEAFVLGEKVGNLAATLLGHAPYLFNEQFVVKGARTGASFAWHQDGAYVGFAHKPYLTLWIALDEATEENGCVYVLPRHLDVDESLVPHRWDPAGKEKIGYEGPERGVPLIGPAGMAVAFSSTTLHSSGANATDRVRRAYICQYSAEPIIDPTTGAAKHFAKPLGARR
ncbi:MAG: phytanoyl-CoA dioxygenase family protein [Proteobacteria bacterium]|nr:phytanoyl-CoA dioxygenase family protein [Pseudomonadota bacterium]MBI3496200.1 phytanoyl-CoA dioxygenase family protein [Pseudomonadota bacterium]